MALPQFGDKAGHRSVMTPEERLERRFSGEGERPSVPDRCLLVFHDGLFERLLASWSCSAIDVGTATYTVAHSQDAPDLGVVGEFGVGAPALGITVEELIALGTTELCIVGGCGTIQPRVSPGDAIVVDRAIRDEGTSHHYLDPAPTSRASDVLVDALTTALTGSERSTHRGATWTTDGFYRETVAEVDHYRDRGVLAVEMEAAALFAIARYRGVDAGALLTPFDRLGDDGWTWDIDANPVDVLQDLAARGREALRAAA